MATLPPGQKESDIFPRFGLPQYANRFPTELDRIRLTIGGELDEFEITDQIKTVPRTNQVSDFHCVTTWSKLNLSWSGYKFNDLYEALIAPRLFQEATFVVLKAQDGYKTSLPLQDLLQHNVLLADNLNNKPLTIEHGAPIRLIAPDHYGYKNLKHLKRIDFYAEKQTVKQGYLAFMDHPRARVTHEERASKGPGIFFRWLYKFGVKSTIKDFELATKKYKENLKS